MKYEYDTHTVGAGAPGNTYSGPIEGAAGPQPEIKYSCSVDFSRHQSGKRSLYKLIQHIRVRGTLLYIHIMNISFMHNHFSYTLCNI